MKKRAIKRLVKRIFAVELRILRRHLEAKIEAKQEPEQEPAQPVFAGCPRCLIHLRDGPLDGTRMRDSCGDSDRVPVPGFGRKTGGVYVKTEEFTDDEVQIWQFEQA